MFIAGRRRVAGSGVHTRTDRVMETNISESSMHYSYRILPSGRVVSTFFPRSYMRAMVSDAVAVSGHTSNDKTHAYRRYKRYRYRAVVVKKIAWNLSYAQCIRLFTGQCAYCHTPAHIGTQLNGIDRVDSTRGYTPDNVVSCCKTCNYAKGVLGADEFVNHCARIVASCRARHVGTNMASGHTLVPSLRRQEQQQQPHIVDECDDDSVVDPDVCVPPQT